MPAKCGVGKVNATICAQMLRDPDKSEAIAFSGVAEGLVRIMAFGDMVIGSSKIPKPCAGYSAPPALATEMEGAAVGYIRGLLGIPFVIIRGISDGARVRRRIPTSRRTSTRCDKTVTGYWRSSFPSREAFASYLVGSSDTSIITLPKFSPFKRPISVAGAFSIPATRCSLYFTRPSRTHWPISR